MGAAAPEFGATITFTQGTPMSTTRNVAVLVGSLRKESFNRKMALKSRIANRMR